MHRDHAKKTFVMTVSLVLSVWLGGAALCLGGGTDSALQKHFAKVFPGTSKATLLESGVQSSRSLRIMEMRNGAALLGYGVEVEVVSRSGPFLILVAVSPAETVLDVQIPMYPHKRGRGVRKRSFLDQFTGVPYGKPLVLGEQVDGVSGATSSATAITDGVRKALLLVHQHCQAKAEMEKQKDA